MLMLARKQIDDNGKILRGTQKRHAIVGNFQREIVRRLRCVTSGRNEKALVLLICVSFALVAPASREKVNVVRERWCPWRWR